MDEKLTVRTAAGVEVALPVAGVGGRSFAFIVDWHIRLLLALAWLLAALVVLGAGVSGEAFDQALSASGESFLLLGLLPAGAIYFLYHPVLEILMGGRTPGKRMAGVRIVSRQGCAAGVGALLVRNVFRLIDALPAWYVLGLSVALFNRRHLRIGDLAAGTVLIYEEAPGRRALEALAEGAGGLGPHQRELALELLERWRDLEAPARARMARRLLARAAEAPPGGWASLPDKELRARLDGLVKA